MSDLIYQFADAVQHSIDNFLADGVVATGIVIGSILFPRDELLRVE